VPRTPVLIFSILWFLFIFGDLFISSLLYSPLTKYGIIPFFIGDLIQFILLTIYAQLIASSSNSWIIYVINWYPIFVTVISIILLVLEIAIPTVIVVALNAATSNDSFDQD